MTLATFLLTVLGVAFALSAVMSLAWLAWWRSRNTGWVDVAWTFGVGITGTIGALLPVTMADGPSARQMVVAGLIAAWALRLGIHIATRTQNISDDPRYAKLQEGYGDSAARQMFSLVQKQAIMSVPLVLAIIIAAWNPSPGLGFLDFLGIAVLAVAIGGEAIADRQLRRFARNRRDDGEVCDVGLWAWSRHPNYFFQWLGWLAYPCFALTLDGTYGWGFVSFAAPAVMYWALAHVTGVPPLEEHMVEKYGEAYRRYQKRVSAFFPRPPRRTGSAS